MMAKKSRLQRLRARGKLLDEILAWKREEVAKAKRERPLSTLRALEATVPKPLDFVAALQEPGPHLIAEIVRATPAHGLLSHHFDPQALARAYIRGGARAISVVTDARFFQGHLEDLTAVKEVAIQTNTPVLARDFFIEPYQIWAARVAGADAINLIARILAGRTLYTMLEETRQLGMEAIVEVGDEEELARALDSGARVIGLNNRNLHTYTVDIRVTERLRPLVPPDVLVISEDGVHTVEALHRVIETHVHAVLIGEVFVRAKPTEREAKVRYFASRITALGGTRT